MKKSKAIGWACADKVTNDIMIYKDKFDIYKTKKQAKIFKNSFEKIIKVEIKEL